MVLFLLIGSISACRSGSSGSGQTSDSKAGLHIVVSIFPEYDWVKNILGDNPSGAEVTLMTDKGVDLHSYQPSSEDILKISSCDLFIYVGGPSDQWVDDVLKEAVNKDMVVINLFDVLGNQVREEELVEGMQPEEEADLHRDEEGPGEETVQYDEHVWLSLRNAALVCDKIEEALSSLDPGSKDVYQKNLTAYKEKLQALDSEYTDTIAKAPLKTLLFGDRFPFRYMVNDYGLSYYAAFAGCSAETEASFETIAFLAGKLDELSLPAVITIDGSDRKIAETIIQSSKTGGQKILTMHSMQSAVSGDEKKGISYLSLMKDNLKVLKEALTP